MNIGLVKGRHGLPVEDYIFEAIEDPTDVGNLATQAHERLFEMFPNEEVRGIMNLYVTGLTVALVAVLNSAKILGVTVILWHYDNVNKRYFSQEVA